MTNSDASMNLTGGDVAWRSDIKPALNSLMMRILERNNMQKAWESRFVVDSPALDESSGLRFVDG